MLNNNRTPHATGDQSPASMSTPQFRVRKDIARNLNTLEMNGDVDFASIDALRNVFSALVSDPTPLLVDLTNVDYLDCAAVRAVLKGCRKDESTRPVSFKFKQDGKARLIVRLLGLDGAFGLASNEQNRLVAARSACH